MKEKEEKNLSLTVTDNRNLKFYFNNEDFLNNKTYRNRNNINVNNSHARNKSEIIQIRNNSEIHPKKHKSFKKKISTCNLTENTINNVVTDPKTYQTTDKTNDPMIKNKLLKSCKFLKYNDDLIRMKSDLYDGYKLNIDSNISSSKLGGPSNVAARVN